MMAMHPAAALLFALTACSSSSPADTSRADDASALDETEAVDAGATVDDAPYYLPAPEAAAAEPPPDAATLGQSCAHTTGCDPSPYEGTSIASWACYPAYGGRCAFRCDDCPPDNDAGNGGCQVSYLSDAGSPCAQLGGHCVATTGLDGGPVSLCER